MGITRFATNEYARISYEIDGSESDNVAVLLHATLADRGSFAPLRDELAQSMRVLLPDARGHGASAGLKDRAFSVTDMANDLFAVLEAEGLVNHAQTRIHLVGHGQGAVAALELARRRPDLVASLTLIEPDALTLLDGEEDGEVIMAREEARNAYRTASEASYKGLAERAVTTYLDARWGEDWRERLSRPRAAAVRRNVLALSGSLDALDRYRLLPEDASRIMVPARVLAAATSPAPVRQIAQRLGTWLPWGRTVYIAKLPGGAPFTGEGEAAISIVAEWLREQSMQA
jgi:pimeloyl-ACP methyl ester carboxylesterase